LFGGHLPVCTCFTSGVTGVCDGMREEEGFVGDES
jgi:hypothetical protein